MRRQEVGPHQGQCLLAPQSWVFQPPELWEINICCWGQPACEQIVKAARAGGNRTSMYLKMGNYYAAIKTGNNED